MAQAPSIVYYAARTTPPGLLLVGQDPDTQEVRTFVVPKDKLNAKLEKRMSIIRPSMPRRQTGKHPLYCSGLLGI